MRWRGYYTCGKGSSECMGAVGSQLVVVVFFLTCERIIQLQCSKFRFHYVHTPGAQLRKKGAPFNRNRTTGFKL